MQMPRSNGMSPDAVLRFLILALVLTGSVTLLVFAAPGLVTMGLYLFIIPGLILGITPTVFFYLVIFTSLRIAMAHAGRAVAVGTALAAVVAVAFGTPWMMNSFTVGMVADAATRDRRPPAKLQPVSTVAIQRSDRRTAATACDDLCQTLLYNQVSESVVVLPPGSGPANRYRVEQRESCPDPGKSLAAGESDAWLEKAHDRLKAVRLRIAMGECLLTETVVDPRAEITIRRVDQSLGRRPSRMLPAPGDVQVRAIEIETGGRVVARASTWNARTLDAPLHLEPTPSALAFNGWQWARRANWDVNFKRSEWLQQFTSFDIDVPRGAAPSVLAKRIDAALGDGSIPATDPVFLFVREYYDGLASDGVHRDDARRLGRLIVDDRVVDFAFLPLHKFAFDSDKLLLRDPMLQRMERLGTQKKWDAYRALAGAAARLPDGAYRDGSLESLLANPERQSFAPALVTRISDRGAAAAEPLLRMMRQGWSTAAGEDRRRRRSDAESARAALAGLCRLGRDARDLLPALEDMRRAGVVPPATERSDLWRATLVSLGANSSEFVLPDGTQQGGDRYRSRLEKMARNGCRER